MNNTHYEILFLPPTSLRTLIELYRIANQGKSVQISVSDLANSMNLAKSTVREHLKNLEYQGFVQSEEVKDEIGRHLPKYFHLTLPFGDFVRLLFTR